MAEILDGFRRVCEEFEMWVVFPAHPQTVKMIREFGLDVTLGTRLIKPRGYLEFLQLEGGADRQRLARRPECPVLFYFHAAAIKIHKLAGIKVNRHSSS